MHQHPFQIGPNEMPLDLDAHLRNQVGSGLGVVALLCGDFRAGGSCISAGPPQIPRYCDAGHYPSHFPPILPWLQHPPFSAQSPLPTPKTALKLALPWPLARKPGFQQGSGAPLSPVSKLSTGTGLELLSPQPRVLGSRKKLHKRDKVWCRFGF